VDERTRGFDAVWRIVARWWPERVQRVSGVAAADQRRVAERLAKARNAYILTARGTEQHASGSDTVSAWINLALALGLPGREGSGYGCLTGQGNGQGGREHGQKADQLPGYRKIDEEALRYDVLEPAAANVWVTPAASVRTCTRGESGSPGRGRAYSDAGSGLGVYFGELVQRLSNDLKLALNRRTQHCVGLVIRERLTSSKVVNQLCCVQRVPQILSRIRPHTAIPECASPDRGSRDCGYSSR
jgi:hypothetical protein